MNKGKSGALPADKNFCKKRHTTQPLFIAIHQVPAVKYNMANATLTV